jgi:DNA repair exonuclease SbcCD ATPase subunit
MFITPAEAIRRYNVSKPTLYSDMTEGKLSFKFDDRKKRKIDVAELDRLYEKRIEAGPATQVNVNPRPDLTQSNVNQNVGEIERLNQEIGYLKRELHMRQNETEKWQEAFDKAQATADKITALLENKSGSGAGEWEKALKALEERISNQDAQAKKEIEDIKKNSQQQVMRYKTALEAEKNKPFWKKIFAT